MTSPATIASGHTVLLRLPSGEIRSAKVEGKGTVQLARYGQFKAALLYGHPFGLSYEIVSPTELRVIPPAQLEDLGDVDATPETNENIVDDPAAQPLSHAAIEALKAAGARSEDIIQRQIEQHAAFDLKTAFSKDKYRKRKEAKYARRFTVLEPSLHAVAAFLFAKDNQRLRDLRPDALAHVLALANVAPGRRVLVVDDVAGLLVAGVMERLGGTGRILAITDIESPPSFPALAYFNYAPADVAACLASINWAMTDREHQPVFPAAPEETKTERQRQRIQKRAAAAQALQDLRDEFFRGEFDALIVACAYEPASVIRHLAPYLRLSAPVVVHSAYPEPLTTAQAALRADPGWLGPSVHAPWMRQHQALPGRTHPMMSMSGTGGYILSATKVSDDPNAASVMGPKRARKAEPLPERVVLDADAFVEPEQQFLAAHGEEQNDV